MDTIHKIWNGRGGRITPATLHNNIRFPCAYYCHPQSGTKMARIYIGNLPMDVTEKDMDDVFYKFGRIVDIDLKTPARPPAFGFITFQDARDAEEAVRAR